MLGMCRPAPAAVQPNDNATNFDLAHAATKPRLNASTKDRPQKRHHLSLPAARKEFPIPHLKLLHLTRLLKDAPEPVFPAQDAIGSRSSAIGELRVADAHDLDTKRHAYIRID